MTTATRGRTTNRAEALNDPDASAHAPAEMVNEMAAETIRTTEPSEANPTAEPEHVAGTVADEGQAVTEDQADGAAPDTSGEADSTQPEAADTTSNETAEAAVEGDADKDAADPLATTMVARRFLPSQVAFHPFNDPERCKPQPGNPKYDEIVRGIRAQGHVALPGVGVTVERFLKERPGLADQIPEGKLVVVVEGNRRTAASIAENADYIPLVIDDEIMVDGGDLTLIITSTAGHQEHTEFAEAELYARRSEEAGLSTRRIAEETGINQATVSRRLALMFLIPEVRAAVEDGKLPSAEAATLAGPKGLPYGPRRKWQSKFSAAQDSDQRRDDQLAALNWILERGWTVDQAVTRVVNEQKSREYAAAEGIEIIDPMDKFGSANYHAHMLRDDDAVTEARAAGNLVAAIGANGKLVYFTTVKPKRPEPTSSQQAEDAENKHRTEAMKARRETCPKLVASVPARDKLLALLVDLAGVFDLNPTSMPCWTLAQKWSKAAKIGPQNHDDVTEFREAAKRETDPKRRAEVTFALAVAALEVRASSSHYPWGRAEITYFALLTETARSKYEPTAWEETKLDAARLAIAAEDALDDAAEATHPEQNPPNDNTQPDSGNEPASAQPEPEAEPEPQVKATPRPRTTTSKTGATNRKRNAERKTTRKALAAK